VRVREREFCKYMSLWVSLIAFVFTFYFYLFVCYCFCAHMIYYIYIHIYFIKCPFLAIIIIAIRYTPTTSP